MKKTRLLMLVGVLLLSLMLVGLALAADSAQKPQPDNVANSAGLPPGADGAGIDSLSGSYVVFDPSVGGDMCFAPGSPQTFCFRAESYTTDWGYVYDMIQRFDTDWTITNVYVQGTPVCDSGTWGTLTPYYINAYEVDLYHPRYQSSTDHCVAYYCFEVVSGASDGNASWYWAGDDYGSPPYHPCSDDGYTPSGWAACDQAVEPTAFIPPCEAGIYLVPESQEGSACEGESVEYTLSLFNNSGEDGTFDLSYDSIFPIDGPATLDVADGETEPFEVTVTVPCGGTSDTATVTADGNGYSDSATLETSASEGGWETVPASAPSWAGNGYPRDGCTAMNGDGDWVSYEIGDMSGIAGFWGYNLDTNTWFQPAPSGLPADRWAPDWAYDPDTNLCYMTGGANTPGGGTYTQAYVFDPVANTFTQLGDFTSMRDFHTSWVGVLDGVKYLCIGGGVNSASIMIQATQCFDLSQAAPGTWNAENAQMAALPTDPFGAADGVYHAASGDQFWYVGGAVNAGANLSDEVYAWDDADDAWHLLGNTGVARYRVEGDFFNGDFYQLGGSSGGFTYTADIVKGTFNGSTWDWSNEGLLSLARMDNVVAVSPDSIWSIDGYGASSPDYVDHLVSCPGCGAPIVVVDPMSLTQDLPQDYQTADQILNVCNDISATVPLDWELIEAQAVSAANATYTPNLNAQLVDGFAPKAAISGTPKAVPAAINPQDVLWDQYANWASTDMASQDFEAAYDAYDIYAADDFENLEDWTIETIVSRGGWGYYVDLHNATALHWYIYSDYPGKPAGFPGDGLEYWSITLDPTDPQVGLGVYETEDVVLTLDTPITLPSGHWWLVFFPSLEFTTYGQYGWSGTADPAWGYIGMQANPGGGFGNGDDWWENDYGYDYMFRLEGSVNPTYDIPWLSEEPLSGTLDPGMCQPITVTFNSLDLAIGEYSDLLKVLSNDPVNPEVTVPVTLNVVGEADLELHKMASAEEVRVNDLITYTLVVNNIGPDTAMNVVVTDNLPAEVMFKSSPDCTEDMGLVMCQVDELDTGMITFTVVVTATEEGTAVNMAEVAADTFDPDLENNVAEAETMIAPALYNFFLPLVQKN